MPEDGFLYGINLKNCIRAGLIIVGIVLVINWFRENKRNSECSDCKGKCTDIDKENIKKWPTFIIGFIYGITPCAPLILLMGYSTALSVFRAFLIAVVFSVTSTLSPMLFLILIAGVLSKQMYEEIPKMVKYVKLACYIMFIITAAVVQFK